MYKCFAESTAGLGDAQTSCLVDVEHSGKMFLKTVGNLKPRSQFHSVNLAKGANPHDHEKKEKPKAKVEEKTTEEKKAEEKKVEVKKDEKKVEEKKAEEKKKEKTPQPQKPKVNSRIFIQLQLVIKKIKKNLLHCRKRHPQKCRK